MRRAKAAREQGPLEHLRYCGRHQLRHGVVPTVR